MNNVFDEVFNDLKTKIEDITPKEFADYFASSTSIEISLQQAKDYITMKTSSEPIDPISPIQSYVITKREKEKQKILKEIEIKEERKKRAQKAAKNRVKVPNHGYQDIVTLEELAYTITKKFDCEHDEALETSEYILDLMHPNGNVLENFLDKDTRNMFNILQDIGIMKPIKYGVELYNERNWKICLWTLNEGSILKPDNDKNYTKKVKTVTKSETTEFDIYNDLPDDIWKRD